MDDFDESDLDPLALSRLDVISCGLGGAVLLGLVFSIVRQQSPSTVSSPPFIHVVWEVDSVRDNVHPLINAVITPPDGDSFDLPLEDFDPAGRLKPLADRRFDNGRLDQLGGFTLLGFSRFGEMSRVLRTKSGDVVRNDNESPKQVYQLLIANPASGDWTFKARYQNNRNSHELSDEDVVNSIKVDTRVYLRSESAAIEGADVGEEIRFGQTTPTGISSSIPVYSQER